jgi:hypothetical protein
MNVSQKNKTQLLKELQEVVDKFNQKKQLVEVLMDEIDELEKSYHSLVKEIKNNK